MKRTTIHIDWNDDADPQAIDGLMRDLVASVYANWLMYGAERVFVAPEERDDGD